MSNFMKSNFLINPFGEAILPYCSKLPFSALILLSLMFCLVMCFKMLFIWCFKLTLTTFIFSFLMNCLQMCSYTVPSGKLFATLTAVILFSCMSRFILYMQMKSLVIFQLVTSCSFIVPFVIRKFFFFSPWFNSSW